MKQTSKRILIVTDLHCYESRYCQLAVAAELHRPDILALAGDFLDATGSRYKQLSNSECAKVLAEIPCRDVVFTRGNHEHENWLEFAEAWVSAGRKVHALHGEAFVTGPLVIVGFPCSLGDETAFVRSRKPVPDEPSLWLSRLLRKHGAAMRTLWLMHQPPSGTPLTEKAGPISGEPFWNGAIERFSPWLTVSGHDHRTPIEKNRWHAKLGRTLVVNVGQVDSGPLHYTVVEGEFPKSTPCLPSRLKITAFPCGKSITLHGGDGR